MSEAVQLSIVSGAALVALLTLAWPVVRRRSRQSVTPACTKCVAHQKPAGPSAGPSRAPVSDLVRPR